MEDKFVTYLNEINIPESVQNRIDIILTEINSIYSNFKIEDIFVSQVRQDNNITYTSLWLYGKNFCMECKNFLNTDDYDVAFLNNNVHYFNIVKSSFDGTSANDASSISINVLLGKCSCTLSAVGKNCINALSLAKKYYLENGVG